jgi:GDPmannose 4,6-dehydratase
MRPPRALVTGITGQDGSYLAELLLGKGYEVHGIMRRSSSLSTGRIDHIFNKLNIHFGDLADGMALSQVVREVQPHEIYNLAAQSHVKVSFDVPEYTGDTTGLGTLRLLEAVRMLPGYPRLYQASSSEMFGASPPPQNELTPFYPRSPYGCAKVYSYWITKNYRESYGMHASNGILFNHESPRRGETFVTRKIAKAVARIRHGLQKEVVLGNLEARRDWGHARDFVQAMWLMLQQDKPDDYVIATGETHSVAEFCEVAFKHVGLDDWPRYIKTDPKYFRPAEVDVLLGDPSKAKRILKWKPTVGFRELVHEMVDAERSLLCSIPTR